MAFRQELLHPATAEASRAAAAAVTAAAGSEPIRFGIVLGTGLGALADQAEGAVAMPYAAIPHFPGQGVTGQGVTGHAGRFVVGHLSGQRVALLQGRVHYYEYGDAQAMRVPLETLALLGAGTLVVTNAAGGLRPEFTPPTLVAMADHINFSGRSPLIGDPTDFRFVNMTDAYDASLRRRLQAAAERCGMTLPEGVYAWLSGPGFETPAEIRMLQRLGADLVGMSSVPEVIMARRLGLAVAGVSMVTNLGAGMDAGEVISHEQTKSVASRGADAMARLIRAFLSDF